LLLLLFITYSRARTHTSSNNDDEAGGDNNTNNKL